jgi:hypothetical protein
MKPLREAFLATLIAAAVLLGVCSLVLSQSSFPGPAAATTSRSNP